VRVVVADTSPLHYLVLTNTIDLLPRLFEQVIAPEIVRAELLHPEAPVLVRTWAAAMPGWLTIMPAPPDASEDLGSLDAGERAAIVLSEVLRPDLILMDDRDGVAAARRRGFSVTGTLGLFERAAHQGLIELEAAFAALQATSFRARRELYDLLLAQNRARRGGS
jgi:predicted nucleic acid-binding protein